MKTYFFFEFAMLNPLLLHDLINFCVNVFSHLSFDPFFLTKIFLILSAKALFYDILKDALRRKEERKEILEQVLDPNEDPDRRVVDIGWATLFDIQGKLERVIFQNDDPTSSWLVEAYRSKPTRFNLGGDIRTGILVKIADNEQSDKALGICITPYAYAPYLARGEGGIWTTRPPIREYFKYSAPRDIVHPKARLLSEGRPIIFDRSFKKMFVRGLEREAHKLDR